MPRLALAVLSLSLCACLFDEDFKHDGPTTPEPLNDGWEIATPESQGMDPQALAAIHTDLLNPERFVGALAFLVVKNGKLVFETYLQKLADRDHVHHVQSITKSFTSLVLGMGRDQGWVPALDTPLCNIVAEHCQGLDPRKQAITLDHLLTMRSGLDFDSTFCVEMWIDNPSDPIRHILDKPLYADPGARFYYRDADPQLISYALQALSGRTEESLAAEFLFGPLGITDWYWDRGGHGETMGPHGLHLRPRDLAKMALMMADGGVWKGTPIISANWYNLSTTWKVAPDGHPRLGYGYYWWTVPEAAGYTGWGHGGQFALVIPGQRLVLLMISMPDPQGKTLHGGEPEDFLDLTRPLWAGP